MPSNLPEDTEGSAYHRRKTITGYRRETTTPINHRISKLHYPSKRWCELSHTTVSVHRPSVGTSGALPLLNEPPQVLCECYEQHLVPRAAQVGLLGWLVDRKITPHVPVWDKSARHDGTFSQHNRGFSDFALQLDDAEPGRMCHRVGPPDGIELVND